MLDIEGEQELIDELVSIIKRVETFAIDSFFYNPWRQDFFINVFMQYTLGACTERQMSKMEEALDDPDIEEAVFEGIQRDFLDLYRKAASKKKSLWIATKYQKITDAIRDDDEQSYKISTSARLSRNPFDLMTPRIT